jgi:hypothetical protein
MALLVGGCAFNFLGGGEVRESWRDQEERACLRQRQVVETAFIQRVSEIDGRGACGIDKPLKVAALGDGTISLGHPATLGCPMTAALERWLQTSVQPAAIAWFGMPVVELKQMGTYACRSRNNVHGARLSEHAFGNAIDIGGFTLASGRTVTVKGEFLRGSEQAQGFLREVFATACQQFKTVLGPGAPYHSDHFHLDLAHHNAAGTSRYCNPTPSVIPPQRAPYRGDIIASRGEPGPLLAEAPPDVVEGDLNDPFGVAQSKAGATYAAAAPPPEEGDYPPVEESIGSLDPGYVTAAPTPQVATMAPPPVRQTYRAPPLRRQGFLGWLINPRPPADIPLSYAPE